MSLGCLAVLSARCSAESLKHQLIFCLLSCLREAWRGRDGALRARLRSGKASVPASKQCTPVKSCLTDSEAPATLSFSGHFCLDLSCQASRTGAATRAVPSHRTGSCGRSGSGRTREESRAASYSSPPLGLSCSRGLPSACCASSTTTWSLCSAAVLPCCSLSW